MAAVTLPAGKSFGTSGSKIARTYPPTQNMPVGISESAEAQGFCLAAEPGIAPGNEHILLYPVHDKGGNFGADQIAVHIFPVRNTEVISPFIAPGDQGRPNRRPRNALPSLLLPLD